MVPGSEQPRAAEVLHALLFVPRSSSRHGRSPSPSTARARSSRRRQRPADTPVPRPRPLAQPGPADRDPRPGGGNHATSAGTSWPVEAAREGGKPLVDSLVEADRAIDGVRICVERLRTQAGGEIPMGINAASAGRLAFTRHEPIGVVVAFSAFNHPLNLIVHQVGPAVAAGCPVIVKPAKATPLSCFRFVGILREAGLPEEWCQAAGRPPTTNWPGRWPRDPRVGFFGFIGSGRRRLDAAFAAWRPAPAARWSTAAWRRSIVAADADLTSAAAVAQGRILSCRPGLRLRAAGLRRTGRSPKPWPNDWPSRPRR